ncbi:MAG: hypothetical protein ABI626_07080 [Sphingomicrobium sp.]
MTRKLLIALAALTSTPAWAAPAHDPGPMHTVRSLIDGWRSANFEQASRTLAPQFRLLTLRRSETGPEVQIDERDHLLSSMRSLKAGAWDVRLGTAIEQQDGSGIATVWAPYTFYLNGKKSHCGIETYTLYRLAEGWRIVTFADTHLWDGADAKCTDRAASEPAVG